MNGYGLLLAVWVAFTPLSIARADPTADVFVATNGNDAWSGTAATHGFGAIGPVATLERAAALLRERKAKLAAAPRPLTVLIRGGTYEMRRPLILTAEDSGTDGAAITYAAYPGETPVISGGTALRGWRVDTMGRWQLDLPEPRDGAWAFSSLFVNNVRRLPPRLPKSGYYSVANELPPTPAAGGHGFDRFGFAGNDIRADWKSLPSAELLIYHSWSVSRLPVASVDAASHIVTLGGKTRENWYKLKPGTRYQVINLAEALSEAGEFYLDRERGHLTYIPESGESPQGTSVVAPRLEHLIILSNAGDKGRPVQNIRFVGITFAHTNWTMPAKGSALPQGATGMPAALVIAGGRHIEFDHVTVRHVAGYGIAFGPGSRDGRIANSTFRDLGAGGIEVGDGLASTASPGYMKASGDPSVGGMRIENNTITAGGRIDPAGVGIWIGRSDSNLVDHNTISDLFYTGISVGWTWGYGESRTWDNKVTHNLIHDIGQGVLSDMGGIYTLGVAPGTVISDNVVHDVKAADYGGWGLYNDEGSSEMAIENNLVYRTSAEGYFLHFGREIAVHNNIFAFGMTGQAGVDYNQSSRSLTFERNILYAGANQPYYKGRWDTLPGATRRNILFRAIDPTQMICAGQDWSAWHIAGDQDHDSMIVDPLFVNPSKDDFGLSPDSPVRSRGFSLPGSVDSTGSSSTPGLIPNAALTISK